MGKHISTGERVPRGDSGRSGSARRFCCLGSRTGALSYRTPCVTTLPPGSVRARAQRAAPANAKQRAVPSRPSQCPTWDRPVGPLPLVRCSFLPRGVLNSRRVKLLNDGTRVRAAQQHTAPLITDSLAQGPLVLSVRAGHGPKARQ